MINSIENRVVGFNVSNPAAEQELAKSAAASAARAASSAARATTTIRDSAFANTMGQIAQCNRITQRIDTRHSKDIRLRTLVVEMDLNIRTQEAAHENCTAPKPKT